MAQIQSRVFDLNSLMQPLMPFIQRQTEIQKANEEKLIAYGTLEDLVQSAPENSETYKDYYKVMNELLEYSADMSAGSHLPGYDSTRAVNLFRDYGKVTGRINRINKEIDDSKTFRQNTKIQHPGAIFKVNNVSNNIDELAKGKHINNDFTDATTVSKIMEPWSQAIGQALDRIDYTRIPQTAEYQVEVLQHGGIKAKVLYDIWTTGTSKDVDPWVVNMINTYVQQAKDMIGYEDFDQFGKTQITGVVMNSLTGVLEDNKLNIIGSELEARERNQLQRDLKNGGGHGHSSSSKGSGKSSNDKSDKGSQQQKPNQQQRKDGGNLSGSQKKEQEKKGEPTPKRGSHA